MMSTRSRLLHALSGLAVAAPVAMASWGALALPATAQPGGAANPRGNNGTVKITPVGEEDGIPQNTPHVACAFDIEWYGYDEGADIVSTVSFAMQAPTSDVALSVTGPAEVFVGDDAAGGAGNDPDGEATYTLGFDGASHPEQGYHVKVTVNTPGSQGADTKHKVFWVTGSCDGGPGPNS